MLVDRITDRESQRTFEVVQNESARLWAHECQRTTLDENDSKVSDLPLDMT